MIRVSDAANMRKIDDAATQRNIRFVKQLALSLESNEFPRAHDAAEPRIELFVGGHFVEKTAVDEPHFAGIAYDGIPAEEHRGARTVDDGVRRVLHNT